MRPHAAHAPRWVRQTIGAVLVTAAAFALSVLLVPTIAGAEQAATSNVPHAVGFMPAAEAPPVPERSPAGPALEVAGAVLIVGGIAAVMRSWVSPARAG